MDGFTLCREVQLDPALSQVPVMLYTATYTDTKDKAFARALGAAEVST
ncbi:MAG: hypothetical protein HY332_20680 [Chloroflexi bacterium]|nr:hypothetical protein [Chloroflexota bacterium]